MPDLPDYYTQVSEIEAIAYSIIGGADAAKPTSPEVYDVYFATDTEKLWFCVADGVWGGYWIPDSIFDDHSARHEDGGADELSLAGLAGEPSTLTTHKDLTTGIHGVGAGAIVGTTLAQTLTNKTLTSPTIQGTVGAGTGLTMPAYTLGGLVTVSGQDFDLGSGSIGFLTTGGAQGFIIQSTNDGATGAKILLKHISTSPANWDSVGIIMGAGKDSAGVDTEYAQMLFAIQDKTDGSEDGHIIWYTKLAGSWNLAMRLWADGKLWLDAGLEVGGDIDMNSNKVTELATPTAATDGATKGYVDTVDAKLDDVSHAEPTRALDTEYQNSTKIRVVSITIEAGTGLDTPIAYIGSSSPAGTVVARVSVDTSTPMGTMTFAVPPSYYYRVVSTGDESINEWHEWDLH